MLAHRALFIKWAVAFYQISTNLKGISSMKLHRDLGITQKAAWHMLHRIREAWNTGYTGRFSGPVEVDEHYVGGKSTNMHESKKRRMEKAGTAYSKVPVVGMKDRATNRVKAEVVEATDKATIHPFVYAATEYNTMVYTDDAGVYKYLRRPHDSVKHSAGEYVRGKAHTNGLESFWAMLRRGHVGVYHKMSWKHLHRYVQEFVGRHNDRPLDTIVQLSKMAVAVVGKRLRYSDLIAQQIPAQANVCPCRLCWSGATNAVGELTQGYVAELKPLQFATFMFRPYQFVIVGARQLTLTKICKLSSIQFQVFL